MDTVSIGKLTKVANIAGKVQSANESLRVSDMASATSILTSITAANFKNLAGLSPMAVVAVASGI